MAVQAPTQAAVNEYPWVATASASRKNEEV